MENELLWPSTLNSQLMGIGDHGSSHAVISLWWGLRSVVKISKYVVHNVLEMYCRGFSLASVLIYSKQVVSNPVEGKESLAAQPRGIGLCYTVGSGRNTNFQQRNGLKMYQFVTKPWIIVTKPWITISIKLVELVSNCLFQ